MKNVLMLFSHLHPGGRDAPLSMIQVEFGPLRLSKLARTYKGENADKQRAFRFKATYLVPNRAHQCSHSFRILDRRVVLFRRWLESFTEVSGWIAVRSPGYSCSPISARKLRE